MMKNIKYISMICIAIITTPVYAINKDAGTSTAQFLKIPVGARAVAMGGAYAGLADDIDAVYWNPAGLAQIDNVALSFQHNEYFQGIRYDYLAIGRPLPSGYLALSANYLYLGSNITKTTETAGGVLDSANAGSFDVSDFALNLSYAYKLSLGWKIGATAKWIHMRNDDVTANGAAFDIGFYGGTPFSGLTLGAVAQNIGPRISFISEKNALPLNFKLGATYRAIPDKLLFNVDMNVPIDNDVYVNLGAEFRLIPQWSIRGGWTSSDDLDAGWSAGTGFKYLNYTLDYAFRPRGRLGDAHRISAGLKF